MSPHTHGDAPFKFFKLKKIFFMARRAIPMIAFPRVRTIYIYIYIILYIFIFNRPLTRVCVVYVVKEVTSSGGARSINGRGAEKNARSSSTDQQKESCVAYVETGTNS